MTGRAHEHENQLTILRLRERVAELERRLLSETAIEKRYDEWRVTGQPYEDGPPFYDFSWTPDRAALLGDPETSARALMAGLARDSHKWHDGPHLMRRTHFMTDWETIANE
jgi:hypothetical protein